MGERVCVLCQHFFIAFLPCSRRALIQDVYFESDLESPSESLSAEMMLSQLMILILKNSALILCNKIDLKLT